MPARVGIESLSFKEADSELEKTEAIIAEAGALAQEFLSAKVALEQQSDHLVSECPFLVKSKHELPETGASIEEGTIPERYNRISFEWKGIRQDLAETKSRMSKLLHTYKELCKKRDQISERLSHEEKERNRLQNRVGELNDQLNERRKSFGEQFDGLSYEQAEKWQKTIEEKDLAAEEFEKRIETSVGFLTKHEQQKEKLTERLFALDKEKLDLRYAVESLNKEINDYQKELMGYPDTAAIDKKLQDVKTQLAKPHEQEQTLYGRLKETESEVSRLRGQTKGCELALREAEARLAKAADIWQEKSGGTPFEKASEVKASILDRDDLARLKEDIQMHWDQTKQCESNIKRITEKLDGRSVSEESWEKAAVTKDKAEEAFSKALEERGAAGKALAVIRENHKRFKELEASLAEWQTYIDRLDKLQAVFKGNSFVEYLAEEAA